jgi:hypothetical protein
VKTFVAQGTSISSSVDTFSTAATAAGDAIVLHVFCNNLMNAPTAVSVSASGWTFTRIGSITGSTSSGFWATSFGAIAPDAAATTFTVSWTAASPCTFLDELGDEFTNNDTTGGATTFDAHAEFLNSGDCVTSLTTKHADDTVWAACTVNSVTAVAAGFTKSADDGHGDWTEYKLTNDAANTVEGIRFTTATGMDGFVVTALAIKPR